MTLQMVGKRDTAEQNIIIIIFHSRSHQSLARRDHLVLESEIRKAYTLWLYVTLRFYDFYAVPNGVRECDIVSRWIVLVCNKSWRHQLSAGDQMET